MVSTDRTVRPTCKHTGRERRGQVLYPAEPTRGGSRNLKRGGGTLGLQATKSGGPGGGPTLGPILKSLQRGQKRGGQDPLDPPIVTFSRVTDMHAYSRLPIWLWPLTALNMSIFRRENSYISGSTELFALTLVLEGS